MRLRSLTLATLLALSNVPIAAADMAVQDAQAPAALATPEGARKLTDGFVIHGEPLFGGRSNVQVDPEGAGYRVRVDMQAAVRTTLKIEVGFEPAVVSYRLTPRGNDVYKFNGFDLPTLQLRFGAPLDTAKVVLHNTRMEGLYNIAALQMNELRWEVASAAFDSAESKYPAVHLVASGVQFQQKTAPGTTADALGKMSIDRVSVMQSDRADEGQGHPVFAFGPGSVDVGFEAFRRQAFKALNTFVATHPKPGDQRAAAPQYKALMAGTLPLLDRLFETFDVRGLAVATPKGPVSVDRIGLGFESSGAVVDGKVKLSLSGQKPSIPDGLLPSWQVALIPTDVFVETDLANVNLEAAAKAMIAGAEPGSAKLFPDSAAAAAGDALISGGRINVTVPPSHVTAAHYDIMFHGDALVQKNIAPRANFIVTMNGLDAVIEDIKQAKDTDPQFMVFLATAKGLGKPGPGGTLRWELYYSDVTGLTVNGTKMGG